MKTKTQIGNREADQHLCFRYTDSTIPLLHKSEISSLYPSSVVVQPGLCRTWSESPKTGFHATRLISQDIMCAIFIMWRSHQPRSHPDLNRDLYRERVGVVLSAPIRSDHVLLSIVSIGLIVEKFLAAKKFPPINTIASTIGTIASDRMTS